MLSKFPVTSEKGQYLVKLEEHDYVKNTYNFYLYIPKKYLFGLKRMKRVASIYYEGKDWGYSFIDMAKYMVFEYESKTEEKNKIKKLTHAEIELFKAWNGTVR